MTTNPFLVEPFRFPNVHGRVGGDGGGNGGGRGGGGDGPVPSPKRIRSPLPKPMPTPKSLGFDVGRDARVRAFLIVVDGEGARGRPVAQFAPEGAPAP